MRPVVEETINKLASDVISDAVLMAIAVIIIIAILKWFGIYK